MSNAFKHLFLAIKWRMVDFFWLVVGCFTGASIEKRTRFAVTSCPEGSPRMNGMKESLFLRFLEEDESYRSIKEQTGLALATITRIVKEAEAVQC